MTEVTSFGTQIGKLEESELVFNLGENPDMWMVLFSQLVESRGQNSEDLKKLFVSNSDAWKEIVASYKERGFNDLKTIAGERIIFWNTICKQLLNDQGHVNLLGFYLKALIATKSKKIADLGSRGQTRKRINIILSALGNNAFAYLDRVSQLKVCLDEGKTLSGGEISPNVKSYYENSYTENLRDLIATLAIIIIFHECNCAEDIKKLKAYIQTQFKRPLEAKLASDPTLDNEPAKDKVKEKIDYYYKLSQLIEIQYD